MCSHIAFTTKSLFVGHMDYRYLAVAGHRHRLGSSTGPWRSATPSRCRQAVAEILTST